MNKLKMKFFFNIFLIFNFVLIAPILCQAFNKWPDTGQTTSYTDTFGEDSDYSGNPQSYTKLGSGGVELSETATLTDGWLMVKDNATGLIWEVKKVDDSINDKDNTYTWDDTTNFITNVNNENFGGFSDWRMPTVNELSTIVNYDMHDPAINIIFFPNTVSSPYWSSTNSAVESGYAWYVRFDNGPAYANGKFFTYYVRAVRGGQSKTLDSLIDNGDGTVTDTSTGLMWEQATGGQMDWDSAITYCESLSLANYNDWRLPNSNELKSLVNYSKFTPTIDTVFFPGTQSLSYWSSTTDASNSGYGWLVTFNDGTVHSYYKSDINHVRSVRAGQSVPLGNWNIWYKDNDGDGYGDLNQSMSAVSQPNGYVTDKTDCNDYDSSINPGATEIAGDGIDQDCDGADLVASKTWYQDNDGDGYGDPNNSIDSATKPNGYVTNKIDCDDFDSSIYPGATEIAGDGIDQDCDGADLINAGIWYFDKDDDGYGDSSISIIIATQPYGYVVDNTDCNDNDATVYPGATEITGDGIDQDCTGSDLVVVGSEQISLLSPVNNKTTSFGASGGKVTFSFSKVTNTSKYMLHFELNDIINQTSSSVPVELIPPGTSSSTPEFSETFIGMVYELTLDTATWDVLALYDIEWGVEAYDSSGLLIGSSYKSSVPSKYASNIKFLASTAIALTSPSPGSTLVLSDPAPVFKWDLYTGATQFELILAHVSGVSFNPVLPFPNLILNLLTMDDATWQSMPTGKWYWTVLGYDAMGNQTPQDFTIFDFEIQ
jgi:hypothetical protein